LAHLLCHLVCSYTQAVVSVAQNRTPIFILG
jgi:hypothetical protein